MIALSFGCDDPPPGGSDADADAVDTETAVADTEEPPNGDAADASLSDTADGSETSTGSDTSGTDTTDTAEPPDAQTTVELVHVPPECSVSTQTCSLTVPSDGSSGLKAQVIRDTNRISGEPVTFKVVSGSNLVSLGSNQVTTGPKGGAGTQLQTASSTGSARVKASLPNRNAAPVYWDLTVE